MTIARHTSGAKMIQPFRKQGSMWLSVRKPITASILATVLCSGILVASCRCGGMGDDELEAYKGAKAHYLRGEYAEAIQKLGAGDSASRESHQALLLLAKCHFMIGEPDKAEQILVSLTERIPGYADARIWLVRSYLALGRLDDSGRELERALEFNGDDPRLLQLMAELSEARGKGRDAIDFYSRAASFGDELARVELSLSLIYNRFGQGERALFHLGRSRAFLSPESVLSRPLSELEERMRKEALQ